MATTLRGLVGLQKEALKDKGVQFDEGEGSCL